MNQIDWIFLVITLASVVFYGIYKNRKDKDIDSYLLGNQSLPWYHIGFSVMATQASAITFLSAPGQGFVDGMRFVQFYFGLPLAMIVLSISFVPIFHKLKVYTAYEYLEGRFDAKVRIFTAILFLLSRGLSTGISIYAPSIILSTILGWDLMFTNILMGGLVLVYVVIGGTKAISHTHLQQMVIMTVSLFVVGIILLGLLPENLNPIEALKVAGKTGKMNVLDLNFNPQERYNLWSGLIGGFFLQLSYFGTDQSQVGRYLTGKSIKESRTGLIMNGFLKLPMQFFILLIGVYVFIFYLYNPNPLIFNKVEEQKLKSGVFAQEFLELEKQNHKLFEKKKNISIQLSQAIEKNDNAIINNLQEEFKTNIENQKKIKESSLQLLKKNNSVGDTNDINYIFLRFIIDHLPHGFIGLLIAIIFSASMGSIASAYSSLSATSLVDIVSKTKFKPNSKAQELRYSKVLTIFWGIFCIFIASYAQKLGSSMIELVNILGSWFYGIILGIFIVAFYIKSIQGKALFISAIISQLLIIIIWKFNWISYLWLNPIGVFFVVSLGWLFQSLLKNKNE